MRSQGAEMFGSAAIFIIIQSELYETSKSTLNSLSLCEFSFALLEMLLFLCFHPSNVKADRGLKGFYGR